MPYPVCVFIKKSDGSYFQVRDSDLALIDEWKWSSTQYNVRDFAIDTLGNIFFAKGDTYVRKHAEDGTVIKIQTAPYVRYTFDTVLNSYGYVCNLQKNSDGYYYSGRGYTKDENLDYVQTVYTEFTRNVSYTGIVFEDHYIFYLSRNGVIEKWTTEGYKVKLGEIDISGYSPANLAFIDDYIVFGSGSKLCKVSKAGGAITELPILWDAVTGEPDPPEDGLIIGEIHVGRLTNTTFVVAFECKPSGTDNPYKWFLRKYNLAGSQIGSTIDLGEQSWVSLGSYFDVGEVSPSVVTNEVTNIVAVEGSESATFNANLTNGSGKCHMRGFQYYDVETPGTIWNITYISGYYDNGTYSHTTSSHLTVGHTYKVRAKVQNAIELVYGEWVEFTIPESGVTTEAVSQVGIDHAKGNGTVTGSNITERGFEVKLTFSGTLREAINHSIAGFKGDFSYNIATGKHEGTLIKTVTEEGDFEEGAFVGDLGRFPIAVASDKLFADETYEYRAYAIIDGETYHGDYVEFTTNSYPSGEGPNYDAVSPATPIVEPIPEEEEEVPEFEWPEEIIPELEWPKFEVPPFEFDPDISFGRTFGAFLRRLDTKKDWKTLREKCIIYQENMNQFALTINHNMLVLKYLINDIVEYIDGDVYPSDLKLMNSSQHLTPLYLEEISPNGFKDIINDFRLKDVTNVHELNQNFTKILQSLNSLYESDYTTEPISYDAIEYRDTQPTAKRMILQLEDMRRKSREVRRLVIRNIKRIFTYV